MPTLKLEDLALNPDNPRTITDEKLAQLGKAIAEFGDLGGFVYNRKTKRLVGGHQRSRVFGKDAKVFIERKFKKPTRVGTVAEGYVLNSGERFKYREVEWDETKEKAANIAANKGAGEWDLPKLSSWLRDLDEFGFDLDLTMFDESERKDYVSGGSGVEVTAKDDEVPAPPKVAKTKKGDIYVLGKHRLVCGDSTSEKDLEKLFQGKKVDLTFTSPPYNAATTQMKNGKPVKLYENFDDNMESDKYVDFASTILGHCIVRTNRFVFWNVNYNSNSRNEFIKQILPHLDRLDETICWKKTALPVPRGLTRTWEPIFVFKCFEGEERLGNTNVTEFNYWDINNANALDESHRAAFPVMLPLKSFDLVRDAESVFDPFGGSGTTMIAAEKVGKACFMMELDPIYCDVIVERWEKHTGQKATLQNRERTRK